MRRAVVALSCLLSTTTCAGDSPEANQGNDSNSARSGQSIISAKDFDPNNFDDSTTVDNKWFPLEPGTQFVYEGRFVEDHERLSHRVVFTVTDLSKVIGGVRTIVTWDRDYTEGRLVETELAFFAQDNDGNVWHLGEYPEEYEGQKLVGAPAWIAGLKGASAGILMKAEPALGAPSYAEGYAPPPINWVDRARVYKVDQKTCVPVECYENVLITEEFERDKPGAFQLKYYAPNVGNVRVGWRGANEKERETLVLVDFVRLTPQDMARVRRQALEQEERAYKISKDVYGRTQPAEHTL